MSDKPQLEEQAIAEVIRQAILQQLDSVKRIGVAVRTNLIQAFQGQADSVSIKGKDLTTEGIHIQELEVESDQVSIDPISVLLGQIRLNEPVNTRTHLVLSETDLIQAINSKYVLEKIPHFQLEVNKKFVTVELCPPFSIRLPSENKMRFSGGAKLHESQQVRSVSFSAVMCVRTDTQPILLETFCCTPNQGLTLPFTIAMMQKMEKVVSQPYFTLEGTILRLCMLRIKDKTMSLDIEAQTQEIPSL
ncbi:MAG: DUF2993 domain-containing protein [Myxacorys chilensis ATA2-1-KO14]|jgi:hypothetical protein|nr:DUF2993 domain-containing protein [Myxacorys chilensis ATA2-1-KO14]